jgi:hypothetical protein
MVTTPRAATQIALLGECSRRGVSISADEHSQLARLYGYTKERGKHAALLQSGADVSMMRHAETDGLRIMAWLARYVEAGEDPLKTVVGAMVDAGFDVEPADADWANDGEEEEEEEDDEPEDF